MSRQPTPNRCHIIDQASFSFDSPPLPPQKPNLTGNVPRNRPNKTLPGLTADDNVKKRQLEQCTRGDDDVENINSNTTLSSKQQQPQPQQPQQPQQPSSITSPSHNYGSLNLVKRPKLNSVSFRPQVLGEEIINPLSLHNQHKLKPHDFVELPPPTNRLTPHFNSKLGPPSSHPTPFLPSTQQTKNTGTQSLQTEPYKPTPFGEIKGDTSKPLRESIHPSAPVLLNSYTLGIGTRSVSTNPISPKNVPRNISNVYNQAVLDFKSVTAQLESTNDSGSCFSQHGVLREYSDKNVYIPKTPDLSADQLKKKKNGLFIGKMKNRNVNRTVNDDNVLSLAQHLARTRTPPQTPPIVTVPESRPEENQQLSEQRSVGNKSSAVWLSDITTNYILNSPRKRHKPDPLSQQRDKIPAAQTVLDNLITSIENKQLQETIQLSISQESHAHYFETASSLDEDATMTTMTTSATTTAPAAAAADVDAATTTHPQQYIYGVARSENSKMNSNDSLCQASSFVFPPQAHFGLNSHHQHNQPTSTHHRRDCESGTYDEFYYRRQQLFPTHPQTQKQRRVFRSQQTNGYLDNNDANGTMLSVRFPTLHNMRRKKALYSITKKKKGPKKRKNKPSKSTESDNDDDDADDDDSPTIELHNPNQPEFDPPIIELFNRQNQSITHSYQNGALGMDLGQLSRTVVDPPSTPTMVKIEHNNVEDVFFSPLHSRGVGFGPHWSSRDDVKNQSLRLLSSSHKSRRSSVQDQLTSNRAVLPPPSNKARLLIRVTHNGLDEGSSSSPSSSSPSSSSPIAQSQSSDQGRTSSSSPQSKKQKKNKPILFTLKPMGRWGKVIYDKLDREDIDMLKGAESLLKDNTPVQQQQQSAREGKLKRAKLNSETQNCFNHVDYAIRTKKNSESRLFLAKQQEKRLKKNHVENKKAKLLDNDDSEMEEPIQEEEEEEEEDTFKREILTPISSLPDLPAALFSYKSNNCQVGGSNIGNLKTSMFSDTHIDNKPSLYPKKPSLNGTDLIVKKQPSKVIGISKRNQSLPNEEGRSFAQSPLNHSLSYGLLTPRIRPSLLNNSNPSILLSTRSTLQPHRGNNLITKNHINTTNGINNMNENCPNLINQQLSTPQDDKVQLGQGTSTLRMLFSPNHNSRGK